MEIKETTREVKDYHLSLSHDELAALLADPIAWADNLRAELNWQAPLASAPAAPKPRHARRGGARKAAPKGPGRTGNRGSVSAASRERIECSICRKPVARFRMSTHLAKKHGVTTPPLPTPVISPA